MLTKWGFDRFAILVFGFFASFAAYYPLAQWQIGVVICTPLPGLVRSFLAPIGAAIASLFSKPRWLGVLIGGIVVVIGMAIWVFSAMF